MFDSIMAAAAAVLFVGLILVGLAGPVYGLYKQRQH